MSGIVYTQTGERTDVTADTLVTLQLYRADGTAVTSITLRTNGLGSFSGEFVLPSPCLTGSWRIQTSGANTSFRVEEYKRPTFEVAFDPAPSAYSVDDSIQLTGKAKTFAGTPVQGAKVRYRVTRTNASYWRLGGQRTAQWEGEAMTDADGSFEVPVRFEVDSNHKNTSPWYYIYKVEADVTNGAGETQQGFASLPLGSTSLVLGVKGLPDKWVKEKPVHLQLTAVNLSDKPMNVQITYQIAEKDSGKKMLEGTATANTDLSVEAIHALPSGVYRLLLSAKDGQGRECKAERVFMLFSLND